MSAGWNALDEDRLGGNEENDERQRGREVSETMGEDLPLWSASLIIMGTWLVETGQRHWAPRIVITGAVGQR